MAVLTIAREIGAIVGGEELKLCNALNLRCVSKSTLEERFSGFGISKEYLNKFDECKPGLIGSLTNSSGYYWETLRTVIMQELLKDDVAIFGRGGNFMLHGMVDCLRIRLVAPEAFRIQQVAREFSLSDSDARKTVRQSDSTREKFCAYYYGKSWSDPHNYDLVINTAEISLETIADFLPGLIPPQMTGKRWDELRVLVQVQTVKHALYSIPELQLRFPEVECDGHGTVTLRGSVPSAAAARRAEELVRKIDDVTVVRNELVVVLNDIPNRLPPF